MTTHKRKKSLVGYSWKSFDIVFGKSSGALHFPINCYKTSKYMSRPIKYRITIEEL